MSIDVVHVYLQAFINEEVFAVLTEKLGDLLKLVRTIRFH